MFSNMQHRLATASRERKRDSVEQSEGGRVGIGQDDRSQPRGAEKSPRQQSMAMPERKGLLKPTPRHFSIFDSLTTYTGPMKQLDMSKEILKVPDGVLQEGREGHTSPKGGAKTGGVGGRSPQRRVTITTPETDNRDHNLQQISVPPDEGIRVLNAAPCLFGKCGQGCRRVRVEEQIEGQRQIHDDKSNNDNDNQIRDDNNNSEIVDEKNLSRSAKIEKDQQQLSVTPKPPAAGETASIAQSGNLQNNSDDPRKISKPKIPVHPYADYIPKLVRFNISGRHFVIQVSSASKIPNSRIDFLSKGLNSKGKRFEQNHASFESVNKTSTPANNMRKFGNLEGPKLQAVPQKTEPDIIIDPATGLEYFYFDRSPLAFEPILNGYRSCAGWIHIPNGFCPSEFLAELEFWNIDRCHVAVCCAEKLPAVEEVDTGYGRMMGNTLSILGEFGRLRRLAPLTRMQQWRRKTWRLLEVPNSSRWAATYMVLSCLMIVATMTVLIVSSLEDFQYRDPVTNQTAVYLPLEVSDSICVAWFSGDYLLRLWAAPNRILYIRSPMSIIDLGAVLPFFAGILFNYIGFQMGEIGRSLVVLKFLRVLRILRALRILKVARYSSGFKSMGHALQQSWRELSLLIMFMLTANLMFSTAMYYFEVDHPGSDFPTIPAACWWCIITMTTVGYVALFCFFNVFHGDVLL